MDVPTVQCDPLAAVPAQDDAPSIAYADAGDYRISRPGNPCFFAQTYHSADVFLQRLGAPIIPLEAETETGRALRLNARVAALLTTSHPWKDGQADSLGQR